MELNDEKNNENIPLGKNKTNINFYYKNNIE